MKRRAVRVLAHTDGPEPSQAKEPPTGLTRECIKARRLSARTARQEPNMNRGRYRISAETRPSSMRRPREIRRPCGRCWSARSRASAVRRI